MRVRKSMSIEQFLDEEEPKRGYLADIGEMARHIGVTSQGLYWYEKQGLVKPLVVNSRRKYSLNELCLLSRIRFYHHMGFSTKEIDGILDMDIDGVASTIDSRILEIETALDKELAKLSVLKERARLIRDFPSQKGKIVEVEMGAFFFKRSFKADKRDHAGEGEPVPIKRWSDDIPLTQYASINSFDRFSVPPKRGSEIGLALPEDMLKFANDDIRRDVDRGGAPLIEGAKALYGLFECSGEPTPEQIGRIKEAVGGRIGEIRGTMVWRPITCRRLGKDVIAYWEIWLPLA